MSDHTAEEMKGRVKEAVGDLTGDKGMKREGKLDQASAAAKGAVDKAADKLKEVINPKS